MDLIVKLVNLTALSAMLISAMLAMMLITLMGRSVNYANGLAIVVWVKKIPV